MFIDGRYNISPKYRPVFKGNDSADTNTVKVVEATDNSVSSKAITSYAQGLINAQGL